jgi:hypothetical protein
MSDFHVGQQVVCVDDTPARDGLQTAVRRGSIYTIRQILAWGEFVGLRLVEVRDPPERRGILSGYRAERFRPIRKTSIEVFERMLIKAPEGVS